MEKQKVEVEFSRWEWAALAIIVFELAAIAVCLGELVALLS
jgi:hypothetical protein